MGRFLNADAFISTGQGFTGNNMFAYCNNNPVLCSDSSGCNPIALNPNAFMLQDTPVCGGGAVATLYFALLIGDAISTIGSTIEDLQATIKERMTKSLAKAEGKEYKTQYETHHLSAKKAKNAAQASVILNQLLPNGVNNPQNLVPVKTGVHRRIHTYLYYELANTLIIGAYLSAGGDPQKQYQNVVVALGTLRVFVESLNALSPN